MKEMVPEYKSNNSIYEALDGWANWKLKIENWKLRI